MFESVKDTYTITAVSEFHQGPYWYPGQRTETPTSTEKNNEVNIEVMGENVHQEKGVAEFTVYNLF